MACLAAAGAAPTPRAAEPSRKQRLAALSEEDRAWLTEFVAPIILPEEDKIFLELNEAYQREAFKLDFWARRELPDLPRPLGPGYRDRYEELWKLAAEKYGGWRHDAGRMLLRWGEPDNILKPKSCGEEVFIGLEVWTYVSLSNFGHGTTQYIFYRRFANGPYWMWTITSGDSDAFSQNSCRHSFGDLVKDCMEGDRCAPCEDLCLVYKAYADIRRRQGSRAGATTEQASAFEPLKISTEGLDRQKARWATTTDPNAREIHVQGPSSGPILTPSPTPTPETPHKLSPEEIQDRIRQLEPKYKDFLELARPLLSDSALSQFLQMPAREKDRFIREFWKRNS
jgi:GWxTD domain-containing protein